MKRLVPPFIAALALTMSAAAQPFSITVDPPLAYVSGKEATYTISLDADSSFDATVFLRATAVDAPFATCTIVPGHVNHPYATNPTLTVRLSGPTTEETINIIVEGESGPTVVRDTVQLSVPTAHAAWKIVGRFGFTLTAANMAVDRQRGVVWISSGDSLLRYDDSGWTSRSWEVGPSNPELRGPVTDIAVDSAGTVWGIVRGSTAGFVAYDGSLVRRFTAVDTATGLSAEILDDVRQNEMLSERRSLIGADASGAIWYTGYRGVARRDPQNGTWSWTPRPAAHWLSNMMVVPAGEVWFATRGSAGGGMMRFDGTYWSFFSAAEMLGTGEMNDGIPVTVTPQGDPLFSILPRSSTTGRSLTRYSRSSRSFVPFGEGSDSAALGALPFDATFDRDGRFWYSAFPDSSLSAIVRTSDGDWDTYTPANSGLLSGTITLLDHDANGRIWIALYTGEVIALDGTLEAKDLYRIVSGLPATAGGGASVKLHAEPNPFSEQAHLTAMIPTTGRATVRIHDLLGRQVATLFDGVADEGALVLAVPPTLAKGSYVVQLSTPAGSGAVRIIRQ